jgi:sugar/nucleoside kinase (ribokinase family)
MIAPATVVVAGHATIDDIHQADGRDLLGTFGGGAVYASVGAALVGARVSLVSLVGDDYPVSRLREALGPSVDVSGVRTLPGRSVHNDAWYGAAGERRWEIESWERMEELTPTAADVSALPAGAFVLLTQSSHWQQRELLAQIGSAGARIAIDTEIHYIDTPELRRDLVSLVGGVNVFCPSIEHLHLLFGGSERDCGAYLGELQGLGCGLVAVKQGAAGSTVLDFAGDAVWAVPAVSACAVEDATGAGDAFNGGFVAAVAAGLAVPDAACWGTVAASFVCETIGARIPAHFRPALAEDRFAALRPRVRELPRPSRAIKEFAQ